AGFPVAIEFDERAAGFEDGSLELGELLTLCKRFGEGLAVETVQLGFGIEALQVRGAAGHAQVNDAFGLDRKMRRTDYARPAAFGARRKDGRAGAGGEVAPEQQIAEREAAEPESGTTEKGAAVD